MKYLFFLLLLLFPLSGEGQIIERFESRRVQCFPSIDNAYYYWTITNTTIEYKITNSKRILTIINNNTEDTLKIRIVKTIKTGLKGGPYTLSLYKGMVGRDSIKLSFAFQRGRIGIHSLGISNYKKLVVFHKYEESTVQTKMTNYGK